MARRPGRGNWKKSRQYCYGCKRWGGDIDHKDCPKAGWFRGQPGTLWVDIDNLRMGCDKCRQIWALDNNYYYCSCGHEQKTSYSDETVVVGRTDRVLATDGDMVYVLRRSGAVVVGHRQYHGMSYGA